MTRMMLKRVGILSVAKWQALLMFILGILSGLYEALSLIYINRANIRYAGYYILITPVAWSILAFIATALGGLLYNALAESVGGMVLYLEDTETEFLPPPPPTEFLNL
ncbi:MAG TPA: hypothetical protein VGC91_20465 [Pyrinomonadaceae bacterium]